MKQALKVIDEIKDCYKAIRQSKSPHLIQDRQKHIKTLKRDLKEYCGYKGIDYNMIVKKYIYNASNS